MRQLKSLLLLFPLTIVLVALPATANSCNPFSSYTCGHSTPNVVNLIGTGSTGQSVGILLGSNTFQVNINAKLVIGDDLVIVAAFPNGMSGSVNGVAFQSLLSFPESGATGAIQSTWAGLGINATNVQYGFANLGTIGNVPITVTASGVPTGTILYGEIVDPNTGKILYITPNSEAGVLDGGHSPTPEPGSLTLLGTGLVGLAGAVRRKLRKA